MSKYLILGNGFLGNKFKNYLGDEAILIKDKIGNITTIKEIKWSIREYNPEIVINAIGKTGRPNIDWCEDHKEDTFFSNVTIPTMIACICEDFGKYMVHLGSGCIYNGTNGLNIKWNEYNEPNFSGSWYSQTKIFSEKILRSYNDVLILRIRMPIDNRPGNRNLIDKLIGYDKVINVPNSVTCIPDLMRIAKILMNDREIGIYNVVQDGTITHKRILEMYKEIVDPEFEMPEFITTKVLDLMIRAGRSNCVLDTLRLTEKGIKMRNVETAIEECLREYRRHV